MKSFTVKPSGPLSGEISVPGDKSVSHRAAMLASLSGGEVEISNFLKSEDCIRTVECMRLLGADIKETGEGYRVKGKGLKGLKAPKDILFVGNSGTTIRLLLGILAGQSFRSTITGDDSIKKRPMKRVIEPLKLMGAKISGRESDSLAPIAIEGGELKAIEYALPVASAQVKSAILLAGLFAKGETSVIEGTPTRDHTERMLEHFGVVLDIAGPRISLKGGQELQASTVDVPSDLSSAAYVMVAAAIIPGSDVVIKDVGVNPGRTGIIDVLHRMGASIEVFNERVASGEPVANIRVKGSKLNAVEIKGSIIPRLIDEIPIIALAAAFADGETVIKDAQELRVKESDRIATLSSELGKFGVQIKELPDGMIIKGGKNFSGASTNSHGDHRIAMTSAIAGLVSRGNARIEDTECIETSFPGFAGIFNKLSNASCISESK